MTKRPRQKDRMRKRPALSGVLLTQYATVGSERRRPLRFKPRDIAEVEKWAAGLLSDRKIAFRTDTFVAALQSEDDPIAYHAAWLQSACKAIQEKIPKFPPELRPIALQLVTLAWHAAAHHESITVEMRFRRAVSGRLAMDAALPDARANRERKITADDYVAANSNSRTFKELCSKLGMSGQGVRNFEKKHPELKTR